MEHRPIVAILYDFDKTLSPKNMQDYGFVPEVGMDVAAFWEQCNRFAKENRMDPILAYMYYMTETARGKKLITRQVFYDLGKTVQFFPGVPSWFDRANAYAAQKGLSCEHYIISSGLKEIIEGTAIARHFKAIFAAEFYYDDKSVPVWPAMAVNYTSKTQFLFRINKGLLDVTEHDGLNEYTPDEERRVPFRNMIYIGDGPTDVPCMKLCRVNGGHSIAVYQADKASAEKMLRDGRIDFAVPADYSEGSPLERAVFAVMDKVASQEHILALHKESRRRVSSR